MVDGYRGGAFGQAVGAVLALVCLGVWGDALDAQAPALTPADYAKWERLGAFELDPTGRWVVASVTRVDETTELRLRRADGDGAGDALVLEHASRPLFSADGRWLAYRKGAPPARGEQAEEADEREPDRLGLVDLATRADTVLFAVTSFAFRDDGLWLAARGEPASDSVGADLIVMNPASGARTLIGNVSSFEWQDEGALLAATLQTAWRTANGVVLFDPEASTLRTLDSRDAEYRALTWRDRSSQLGVMRSVSLGDAAAADEGEIEGESGENGEGENGEDDERTHDVLVWDVRAADAPRVLEGAGRADLPDTFRIAEHGGIDFDEGGRTVFVGVRPWEHDRADSAASASDRESGPGRGDETDRGDTRGDRDSDDEGPGPADVQVWHWDDDEILRAQEYRADALSRRTLAAAWHLADDRLVLLGDDLSEPVEIVAAGRWGLVPDYDPYRFERRFGAGSADWYRVDPRTGRRDLLATGLEQGVVSHEDESAVLLYRDDTWSVVDLGSLEERTLAEGRSFTRSLFDYDYPGPRPPWGVGGWIEGEDAALLYDKHDVWRVSLADGAAERLTRGAEEGRQYRIVDLDPDAGFSTAPVLDPDAGPWLSVRDLRSKESGYARLSWDGSVETPVFEEARVAGLTKARDADRFALRMERWDDSPDVYVAGPDLGDLRRVTETNPFQAEYAWGRTELLDYTTDAGHDLQAILVYPAGFEEGGRYPLILYQYERLSDNLHAYNVPSERSYYNYQAWSQQGYFVLMPDIVYEPGRPGPSALDAVEHALDAAVATGHVDAARLGLIGHSWGGYQASYLPTRTDRFAASVAGAAITNFMSFMGAVHWNGGLPETGHWETGQARMAVPYWEDLEGHLESSPAHFIADLDTPMLLMHGDEDGVVDFYQGLEFYNYARRAGKEVVLLVYPGADHGLSDEAQQVDYHRRILEWFGHHLKGEPAAKWITDGESWVERGTRMGR
jgi:dipeptidyl aminopeptidase/acylaminoacyl peptidase